jgi:2-polyprenyl-6-hydroxyphenyl methylase/3-demethylubiquinone-9 3-methyltransferase
VTHADTSARSASVDADEVAKFERLAAEWWDPDGGFRPLHKLNPARLAFLRDTIARHFGRDAARPRPFAGIRLLDIGSGGGLVAEPMARLGAEVVGIDPGGANIEAARMHAAESGLALDYRATEAEALAAAGERFDVVLALEVVEHVPDVQQFIDACARLLKPGGLLFLATINRTPKAFALAIVGAEYLLRWLPRGTHAFSKFQRPDELEEALARAGLAKSAATGLVYDVLRDSWKRSTNMDVNYMLAAELRA